MLLQFVRRVLSEPRLTSCRQTHRAAVHWAAPQRLSTLLTVAFAASAHKAKAQECARQDFCTALNPDKSNFWTPRGVASTVNFETPCCGDSFLMPRHCLGVCRNRYLMTPKGICVGMCVYACIVMCGARTGRSATLLPLDMQSCNVFCETTLLHCCFAHVL